LEEATMNLILGMDIGVFLAWVGTILATVLCLVYGLYYQYVKKPQEKQPKSSKEEDKKQVEAP
jgi:Na+-driven multidrug efflux pump